MHTQTHISQSWQPQLPTDKQSTWNMIATHYWSVMCTCAYWWCPLCYFSTTAFSSPVRPYALSRLADRKRWAFYYDMRWQSAKGVNQWINNPSKRSISIASILKMKKGKLKWMRVCRCSWINEWNHQTPTVVSYSETFPFERWKILGAASLVIYQWLLFAVSILEGNQKKWTLPNEAWRMGKRISWL